MRTLLLLNVFEAEVIGERIKRAREQAGLRQEDLADLLSVSTRSVQGYEAGATKPFKHLNEIAEATGVTTAWLLHGDPDESEESVSAKDDEIRALRGELGEVRGQLAALQSLLEERLPVVRASRRRAS